MGTRREAAELVQLGRRVTQLTPQAIAHDGAADLARDGVGHRRAVTDGYIRPEHRERAAARTCGVLSEAPEDGTLVDPVDQAERR